VGEARGSPRVVCCLDARMGQIYQAAYEKAGTGWVEVHAPGLCAPGEAPLVSGASSWPGAGRGFKGHGEALERRYAGRMSAIIPDVYPHARDVARLAVPEFEQGRAV